MEEKNVRLTGADAVFVPENISEDLSDYTVYKAGMFRSVPANCYLVSVNVFTGNVVNLGGQGLKFTIPVLTKTILVPNIDRTIDYPKADYLTSDHITAGVDIALSVRIVDPVKYVNKGKHQLEQLNHLTQSLLRVYIQRFKFESLSSGVCKLNEFDPNNDFRTFEDEYGIKINRVILKEIKLPADLQKQYDDVIEANKKKERQRIELEIKKEEARAKKEIALIEAEMYLMKFKELVTYLKEQGLLNDEITEVIKMQMMSENQNASFFVGGNGMSQNIAAGVAAGNGYTRTRTK